ncbi:MAG: hypothetical protein HQL05_14995 [Nitrospirae bacterium]|nr:hypothetical protein [Nitrospirota bacterium]
MNVPKENRLPLSKDDRKFLARPDTDLIKQSIFQLGLKPRIEEGDHVYVTPNGKILNTRYHSDIGPLFYDRADLPADEVLSYMNEANAMRVWMSQHAVHAEITKPPTTQQVTELLRTIGTGKEFSIDVSSSDDRSPVTFVKGVGSSDARAKLQEMINAEFGGHAIDAYTGDSYSIQAYHGSPHKFDRFSMESGKRGEGTLWEGYGINTHKKKGEARHYAELGKSNISMYGVFYLAGLPVILYLFQDSRKYLH